MENITEGKVMRQLFILSILIMSAFASKEITFNGTINFTNFNGNSTVIPDNLKVQIRSSDNDWQNNIVMNVENNGSFSGTFNVADNIYNNGDSLPFVVFGDTNQNDNWDGDSGAVHGDGTVENDIRYLDTHKTITEINSDMNLTWQSVELFGYTFTSKNNESKLEESSSELKITGYPSGQSQPKNDFIDINVSAKEINATMKFVPANSSADYFNSVDIRIVNGYTIDGGQEEIYEAVLYVGDYQGNPGVGCFIDFRDGNPRAEYNMDPTELASFDITAEHEYAIIQNGDSSISCWVDGQQLIGSFFPNGNINFIPRNNEIHMQGEGVVQVTNLTTSNEFVHQFNSTAPVINQITFSGIPKQFELLTFAVDYNLSDGRTLDSILYNFDGSFSEDNNYSYYTSGQKAISVKVTDDQNESTQRSINIDIEEVPYEQMTLDQKIKFFVPRNNLEDVQNEIETCKSDANASGWSDGNITGYTSGYSEGNTSGYNTGHGIGFSDGNITGYNYGFSDGNLSGYNFGYDSGHTIGYSAGDSNGYDRGFNLGYSDGNDSGYGEGRSDAIDDCKANPEGCGIKPKAVIIPIM
jgi:hypothetical protein